MKTAAALQQELEIAAGQFFLRQLERQQKAEAIQKQIAALQEQMKPLQEAENADAVEWGKQRERFDALLEVAREDRK